MRFNNQLIITIATLGLAACTTVTDTMDIAKSLPDPTGAALCANEMAELNTNYPTARVNACETVSNRKFRLTIRPENRLDPVGKPINNSAWYGFRIDPKQAANIEVTLKYENGKHRYQPKISFDGTIWTLLDASQIEKVDNDEIILSINTDTRPFYISGQEIFSKDVHDKWTAKMEKLTFVTASEIGASRDGHPIQMLDAKVGDKNRPYVVLVGRQHPPEVTGALALIPFAETVLGDSKLAKEFREKYNVLVVPMMNPDGVTAGHWRFNKGGTDLNRDWGPFVQPETQAVQSAFKRFDTGEAKPALFLDFHSTWKNLFYTQKDEQATSPPLFAKQWLAASDARIDDDIYPFTRSATGTTDQANSKNYMFKTYGITAITYEVGDHTDRAAIEMAAKVFAEEMMKLMLEHAQG